MPNDKIEEWRERKKSSLTVGDIDAILSDWERAENELDSLNQYLGFIVGKIGADRWNKIIEQWERYHGQKF